MQRPLFAAALIAACGGTSATCPECPTCPAEAAADPAAGSLVLDEWELALLSPTIDRVREGIKPFGAQAFGICAGTKACTQFLGTDPGSLPPGDYLIMADLDVPKEGEGWTVRFDYNCEIVSGAGRKRTRDESKVHSVAWTGGKRGYRLEPMWRLSSPQPGGEGTCTYSLTPIRPDGKAREPWTGSFSTPAGAK